MGKKKKRKKKQQFGLPSFHLGEVDSYEPVGQSLLVQIAAVAPDKGGHVVA